MENFLKNTIEELTFESVEVTDSLIDSGVVDSITVVDLAVAIESEFKVKIPFNEIVRDNFETIEAIINYVNGLK